jgi:hypothetical protein
MYGLGILKGMAVTMRHFIVTYLDDIKWLSRGGRYYNDEAFRVRQSLDTRGVITVFYPEEKLATPERFRFVPFLVTDDHRPASAGVTIGVRRAEFAQRFARRSASGSSAVSCPTAVPSQNRLRSLLTLIFA